MKKCLIVIGIVVLLMIFGLCGCVEQKTNIIGQWTREDTVLVFKENKEIIIASGTEKWTGNYSTDDNLIHMDFVNEATIMGFSSTSLVFKYHLENPDKLLLTPTWEGGEQTTWTRIQ